MAALDPERGCALAMAVDAEPPFEKFAKSRLASLDDGASDPLITQATARRQRVGQVLVGRVPVSDGHGDAALGQQGARVGVPGTSENNNAATISGSDRGADARRATADDEDICSETHGGSCVEAHASGSASLR